MGGAIRFYRRMMHLRLLTTAPAEQSTYARRMFDALGEVGREAGHDVAPIAVEDAARSLDAVPAGAVVLIDGGVLPRFLALEGALQARGFAVLLHHPSVMEPGLSAATHDARSAAERVLLPVARRIIVGSEAVAGRLAEAFGVVAPQAAIVQPGVDPAPRRRATSQETCAILSIGALLPRKGHDVLLRALGRLFDLDWRLTIVGAATRHPAHAAALQALAADLGIARRVRFVGDVSAADLDLLWQECDLFALASHWEATYGAAAAALRRGIPAAVCDGGAAASVLTPMAGAAAPPGDVEGLSKALRRIIFDPGLRAELAAAAWQIGVGLPTWADQAALLLAAITPGEVRSDRGMPA